MMMMTRISRKSKACGQFWISGIGLRPQRGWGLDGVGVEVRRLHEVVKGR